MRILVLGAAAAAAVGLWCLAAASAGAPVNPNLSPEARQVFKYLESTYQKKVLAGYKLTALEVSVARELAKQKP